jgi:hypothetical protein
MCNAVIIRASFPMCCAFAEVRVWLSDRMWDVADLNIRENLRLKTNGFIARTIFSFAELDILAVEGA